MSKSRLQRQIARNVAQVKLYGLCHPYETKDLAWKQYGVGLLQYPRDEWPKRLAQVPENYRDLIRARLIAEHGYQCEP